VAGLWLTEESGTRSELLNTSTGKSFTVTLTATGSMSELMSSAGAETGEVLAGTSLSADASARAGVIEELEMGPEDLSA